MSSGNSIATAYVQIVPSAEGIKGSLTNLLGGEADSAGISLGSGMISSLVGTIGKLAAAAGIGKILSESISAGADYEQLTGGVETLFGDSADTIKNYAKDAYSAVGMSANEYMETSTSFAASLINSLGGDTEKAAEQANKAIQEMSDNSNKMGTDMESIQNAYQGFAKNNYTMLDNLKLGYSGSKEGMEQLLADASAISGIEYDISSYSDVVDAIGVIQDKMGITGTTAKEASETFSGSFAAMQASAENLLTAISSGEDLNAAFDSLLSSAETFLIGNALPMAETMITEITTQLIPDILNAGIDLMNNLADGILEGGPLMSEDASSTVNLFIDRITALLPRLISAGGRLVVALAKGLIASMPQIGSAGLRLLTRLISGILSGISQLPAAASRIISSVRSSLQSFDWGSIGKNIISGIANGIRNGVSSIISAAKSAASSAFNAAKSALGINSPSRLFRDYIGKNIDLGMAEGITQNTAPVNKAMTTLSKSTTSMLDVKSLSAGKTNTVSTLSKKMDEMIAAIQEDKTFEISGREFGRAVHQYGY